MDVKKVKDEDEEQNMRQNNLEKHLLRVTTTYADFSH